MSDNSNNNVYVPHIPYGVLFFKKPDIEELYNSDVTTINDALADWYRRRQCMHEFMSANK